MNQPIVYEQNGRPGCLLQVLYFVFIGWWLGLVWVTVAWLLNLSIIGLPLGAAMLNNVPQVIALRGRRSVQVDATGRVQATPQLPFLIRALYFVLIGWWFSGTWMIIAYVLCLTVIGLPLGFLMFDAVPMIVSLKRT